MTIRPKASHGASNCETGADAAIALKREKNILFSNTIYFYHSLMIFGNILTHSIIQIQPLSTSDRPGMTMHPAQPDQ